MNAPSVGVAVTSTEIEGRRAERGAAPRLRPPADRSVLAEVEDAIGRALPVDLRTVYLVHDGQEY